MTEGEGTAEPPAATFSIDTVLAPLRSQAGLPSLGATVTRLTRLLDSDQEAVAALAEVVLADVALTQRLLHVANTLPFRVAQPPVTTVTRAITLLGFNRVRALTISLVLLDRLVGPDQAAKLRAEFGRTLLAGSVAAELLGGADAAEAEEACIAAMFRSVGRLMVAVFAPDFLARVRAEAGTQRSGTAAAARRVLGCSFEEIAAAVLRQWDVPDRIVAATQTLPPRLAAPRTAADRIRVAAQFADEAMMALHSDEAAPEAALDAVLERFTPAFAFDRRHFARLLDAAVVRTREFETACGLAASAHPVGAAIVPIETGRLEAPPQPLAQADAESPRPANGRELLLAGLAEATEALARGHDAAGPHPAVRIALEAIHAGLGFERTALALANGGGTVRSCVMLGEPRARFDFPLSAQHHLFAAAIARATDLYIGEAGAEKVRAQMPAWFERDFGRTRSFLLMALAQPGQVSGFIYADRFAADSRGPGAEELMLLRSLRNLVLMALQRTARPAR
ncbi:MAG TPA: HDOD domain-containing protein [Burkholderiaceae bacterium]